MSLGRRLEDRQAQSAPGLRAGAVEALEHRRQLRYRGAQAVIRHLDHDLVAADPTVQLDQAAPAGVPDGVLHRAVDSPSGRAGTNRLGLVKHLTCVERFVFLAEDVKDWDANVSAGVRRDRTAPGPRRHPPREIDGTTGR